MSLKVNSNQASSSSSTRDSEASSSSMSLSVSASSSKAVSVVSKKTGNPFNALPHALFVRVMAFLGSPQCSAVCKYWAQSIRDSYRDIMVTWRRNAKLLPYLPPVPSLPPEATLAERQARDAQWVVSTRQINVGQRFLRAIPPAFTGLSQETPLPLHSDSITRLEPTLTLLRGSPLVLASALKVGEDASLVSHFQRYFKDKMEDPVHAARFLGLKQELEARLLEFPLSAARVAEAAAILRAWMAKNEEFVTATMSTIRAQNLLDCFARLERHIPEGDRPLYVTREPVERAALIREWMKENPDILNQITTLDLSRLGLHFLPPELLTLRNLQTLNLAGNNLISLPPEIGQLESLRELNLSSDHRIGEAWIPGNPITFLPPEIGKLRNLQHLNLSGMELSTLPPEIGQLENLQTLDLSSNDLTALPREIGNLRNLQTFNLSGNQLATLPPTIGQLENLQTLHLSQNHLTTLPREIENLRNLQTFNLGANRLTTLPREIGNLENLQTLDLYGNFLTSLPATVWQLPSVYYSSNPLSCQSRLACRIQEVRRYMKRTSVRDVALTAVEMLGDASRSRAAAIGLCVLVGAFVFRAELLAINAAIDTQIKDYSYILLEKLDLASVYKGLYT